MRCPHCHEEIRVKGPNCPRCNQPILGREALGRESSVGEQLAAPGVATSKGAVRAHIEREEQAPPLQVSPEEEEEEFEAYVSLDLDTLTAETEQAQAQALAESVMPAQAVEERYEFQKVAEAAETTYDETVMGGVYFGAILGAVAGLRLGAGSTALIYGAAAALVGAGAGYMVGLLAGTGTRAGVRSRTGQQVLLSGGILLATAPLAVLLVWLAQWGIDRHLGWTLATYAVIAFAFFGLTWQDARYRQVKNAILWGIIAGLVPPLYPFYQARRPRGETVECAGCSKNHLAALDRCPHCGYVRSAGRPLREGIEL